MIERTKSFINWSALTFDLQHSKSNSAKRILTVFLKKDCSLTQLFKLNKFGILTCLMWTCITFYKKKEKRTYQRLFKAEGFNFSLKTALLNQLWNSLPFRMKLNEKGLRMPSKYELTNESVPNIRRNVSLVFQIWWCPRFLNALLVGVWIPQLNIGQKLLLSQRYLKNLKEPFKSEQNYKDMLLMKARKKRQMKQNVTSCTFKRNNAGILKNF